MIKILVLSISLLSCERPKSESGERTLNSTFAPWVFRDEARHVTCYRAMNRDMAADGISCVADPAPSCSAASTKNP